MTNTHSSAEKDHGFGIFAFSCACACTAWESLDAATREEATTCFERDGFISLTSPAYRVLDHKTLILHDGYPTSAFAEVLRVVGVKVKPLS